MGYAGYVPAKLPPARPTAIQEALWQIQNPASLEIIAKLLRNVVVHPAEEKYRKIRLSNPKIKALIQEEKGAVQTLRAMGWITYADDADVLTVPKGLQLSMSEVRMVQDAEERLKREQKVAKRTTAASKLPVNKDQARIREQMEADRLERASRAA